MMMQWLRVYLMTDDLDLAKMDGWWYQHASLKTDDPTQLRWMDDDINQGCYTLSGHYVNTICRIAEEQ